MHFKQALKTELGNRQESIVTDVIDYLLDGHSGGDLAGMRLNSSNEHGRSCDGFVEKIEIQLHSNPGWP